MKRVRVVVNLAKSKLSAVGWADPKVLDSKVLVMANSIAHMYHYDNEKDVAYFREILPREEKQA